MPAAIFNSGAVKILKDLLRFKTGKEVIADKSNAQVSSGITAPIGSMVLTNEGRLYIKDGASDTDWNLFPLSFGVSGGQTITGGTASGDDLTLDSTSDATKGTINANSPLNFNTSMASPTYAAGNVSWNSIERTLDIQTGLGNTTLQVGQEIYIYVYNGTGEQLNNGLPVYISGVNGGIPSVALAQAHIQAQSMAIGLLTMDIPNGQYGFVTKLGIVRDIDTSSLSTGSAYLTDTNGELSNSKPIDGSFVCYIGDVLVSDASNGSIFVNPFNSELTVEVTDTNGFPDGERANTELSFVDGTRTFTIKVPDENGTFTEDFSSSTGFIYDPDYTEFSGSSFDQIINQADYPNIVAAASYDSDLNFDFGKTSLTATVDGTVTQTSNEAWAISLSNDFLTYAPLELATEEIGTVYFYLKPSYTSTPAAKQIFFSFCNVGSNNGLLQIRHTVSGELIANAYDSTGTLIENTSFGNWSPTEGVSYFIEFNFDYVSGEQRLFIDGNQLGSTGTATGTFGTRDAFRVFGSQDGSSGSDLKMIELAVYDTVQHTSNYTPEALNFSNPFYGESVVSLPAFNETGLCCLSNFSTTQAGSNPVKYTINDQYWNGAAWAASGNSYAESNTAADVNTNIGTISHSDTIQIRAIFSDGSTGSTVSSISFDYSSNNTIFHFYELGLKYEKTAAETVVIENTEGMHSIYFDGGTLTAIANASAGQFEDIVLNHAFVSLVYWDAANSSGIYLGDERHGISMSPRTHAYLHLTRGAQYVSGLAIADILADENGSLASHAQFSVGSGVIFDEDIAHLPPAVASTVGLDIYALDGATPNLRKYTETGFSVLTDTTAGTGATGRLVFNEFTGGSWQLTTVSNADYVLCHVFAINGISGGQQWAAIIGQNAYTSLTRAKEGAETEISNILSILPLPEIVAVGTVLFQTRDSYTNSIKARIISNIDGDDYTDWRTSDIPVGAPSQNHNNLGGLELANTGVTYGHINDQSQSIYGVKNFITGINLNTTTQVTSILDEDTMASNSATALATQQSIKAYADSIAASSTIYINQPSITAPTNGSTGIDFSSNITTSAFSIANGGSDTHESTDWQIAQQNDSIIFSSYEDAANKVSLNISSADFTASKTYKIRCRHIGATYGESQWSDYVYFTTATTLNHVDTPSISNPAEGETNFEPMGDAITSSAYSHTGDATHVHSDWEMLNAGTKVIDASSYDDTTGKVSKNFDNSLLTANTNYLIRVRHNGSVTGDSLWSDYINAKTPSAFPSVDTPTVSYPTPALTGVTFATAFAISALSLSNEQSQAADHASTTWQCASDSGFSTIVKQSADDTSNLTTYFFDEADFSTSTTYYFRALVEDANYGDSSYSTTVTFTTAAAFIDELWSTSGALSTAKRGHTGLGSKNAALAVSGYDGGASITSATQDFNGSTWSAGTAITVAKFQAGSFGTYTSGLVFCGASDTGSTPTDTSYEWNGTSWSGGGSTASTSAPSSGCGTLNSGFGANIGGNSYGYNGTSWSNAAALNDNTKFGVMFGTASSAFYCGDDAAGTSLVQSWNGTAWSAGTSTSADKYFSSANGTTSKGMVYGYLAGAKNNTEVWNGTSWSAGDALNTARGQMGHCGSYSTAICSGGFDTTPTQSAVTEIYT